MKLPSRRAIVVSVFLSLLGGVALAAWQVDALSGAISGARQVGATVASGLGGKPSNEQIEVSVNLCFGLIPLGYVEKPYLVTAADGFIVGTVITACAILIFFMLRKATINRATA